MQVDPEYLRQHYATLSDEALLETNRAELVDAARQLYDDELQQRGLSSRATQAARKPAHDAVGIESLGEEEKPEWFEEGAEVYSWTILPGQTNAQDAADAADALRSEGIPCYLEMIEIPQRQERDFQPPTHQWRLLVPGKLNLRATSVLEKELFNPDMEAEWRAHLESLSDSEVTEMDPLIVYAGLFDRIERLTKVYEEELLRRGSPRRSR